MARQRVGPKKVAKYARVTGLPVLHALVRGGTDHRVDLLLEDGSIVCYKVKSGETWPSAFRWRDIWQDNEPV